MKKVEIHLKKFMEVNEAFVNNLEPQVHKLTDKIREVRKKINAALDELEKRVKTEGNRIYKEEVIRIQDENHQCLSLIHAVRNSQYLLETVNKYGSNLQKFIMSEKMRLQLQSYCSLVGEKYMKTNSITLEMEFTPPIQSILSVSLNDLGRVVTTASSNTLLLTCLRSSIKDCRVERVDVIDLKVPTGNTNLYTGVTFLPGDNRVMLADHYNNQCILLSSSYQFITSHTLTGKPLNICVLDGQEVAVSLSNQCKIQILSVIDDVIRPLKMVTTIYMYNFSGIAATGKGEMVVNGYCGNKAHWSLINTRGDVKCTHQYDSSYNYFCYNYDYIALNNKKTRVYISVHTMHSLLCFGMDGRKQFTYSPDNLRGPSGVAVDRYDNIYVLGRNPNNIHRLSPDGSVIQVVSMGVPEYPRAIFIHKSKDILVITNGSDQKKLHIYQLK